MYVSAAGFEVYVVGHEGRVYSAARTLFTDYTPQQTRRRWRSLTGGVDEPPH